MIIDGSTPLHAAVYKGYSEITELLLAARPSVMYMENGVGETLLEMASIKDTFEHTKRSAYQKDKEPRTLTVNEASKDYKRIDVERLEVELPRLRSMLQELLHDRMLIRGTMLAEELIAFADEIPGITIELGCNNLVMIIIERRPDPILAYSA